MLDVVTHRGNTNQNHRDTTSHAAGARQAGAGARRGMEPPPRLGVGSAQRVENAGPQRVRFPKCETEAPRGPKSPPQVPARENWKPIHRLVREHPQPPESRATQACSSVYMGEQNEAHPHHRMPLRPEERSADALNTDEAWMRYRAWRKPTPRAHAT